MLQGSVDFSSSSPTCSSVGTEPNQTTNFSHGRASNSVSMDITVTNTDATTPDPGDHTHVTGNIQATGNVKNHNGSMASYKLTGTGKVSVVRAEGNASQCDVTANMTAESLVIFTLAKSGWVYVTRSQVKNILTEMVIEGGTNTGYIDLFGGPKSKNTERVFLKAGQYEAISAFIVSGGQFLLLKATPTATLSGAFHKAGSALGGTKGSGKKFVKFPGSVSCSHHSAKLTWSGKAGQVAKGSFFVNGSKKKVDGHPVAGHHVVLKHLKSKADNKITAKLSLNNGGKAQATRVYIPCKG